MEFFGLDLFSPIISIYYKKNNKHSSIPSTIISFIAILSTIFLPLYFIIKMIKRKNFSAYYYDIYVRDPPGVSFDKKGLFHYLTLNTIIPNDKILTVIGYENKLENYLNGKTYSDFTLDYTYIYGKCTSDDMNEIENMIENKTKFLQYSYCIKKAIRIKDKKIIYVNDTDFVWPKLIGGVDHRPYSIHVSKCTKDPDPFIGKITECENENIINEYLKDLKSAYLYFIDNYIDLGHFKNPIIPYFFPVDCQADLKINTFIINNINLNLAVVNSHQNFLSDKVTETYTTVFIRTDVISMSKISNFSNILCAFIFWEKKKLQVYERIYTGIFELLSSIGGIYHVIVNVLSFVNIIFSKYKEYEDAKFLYEQNMNKDLMTKSKTIPNNGSRKLLRLIINKDITNQNSVEKERKDLEFNSKIENNVKSINEKKINVMHEFCKYIRIGIFGYYLNSKEKDFLKYIELKKEILSEEFIYSLYFEKRQNENSYPAKEKNIDDSSNKIETTNIENNSSNIPIRANNVLKENLKLP